MLTLNISHVPHQLLEMHFAIFKTFEAAYPTLIVNSCMVSREAILSRLVRIDCGSEDGSGASWMHGSSATCIWVLTTPDKAVMLS